MRSRLRASTLTEISSGKPPPCLTSSSVLSGSNVAVLVGDLARYSEFAGKADAIIGMDLLKLSDVTIDLDARNLIFDLTEPRSYVAGGDPMVQCLIVEFKVQDRPVRLIVDTGLQGILLYEERLRKSVPELRTAGSIKNATMGGRVQVKQATLPGVIVGNRNREVPVVFLPSPAAGTLPGIDGVVGITALQAHRVHFDFSRRTLTWEKEPTAGDSPGNSGGFISQSSHSPGWSPRWISSANSSRYRRSASSLAPGRKAARWWVSTGH